MSQYLAQYPIWQRLLSEKTDNSWHAPYSERRLEGLDAALSTWATAHADGKIDNARLVESKEVISRALDHAWSAVHRERDVLDALSPAHAAALDTCPNPNLSNVRGRLKRVSATPESELRATLISLLSEWEPLVAQYEYLRANAVKRQPKTQEEKDAQFQPPKSDSVAVAACRAVLEQAIDRTFQELVDRRRAGNQRRICAYLDAQEEALEDSDNKTTGYSPTKHFTVKRGGYRRAMDQDGVSFLYHVLEGADRVIDGRRHHVYETTSETTPKSDASADKDARYIRDQFLYKSLTKLTPILEAKGDAVFDKIEEIGQLNLEGREGEFLVAFKDGSSFRLRNAVVFVVNQFETHFCRFPTTFHDVRLPGGVPMPSPSEERMHTLFVPAPSASSRPKGP